MKNLLLATFILLFSYIGNSQNLVSGMPTTNGAIYGILPIGDTAYIYGSFWEVNGIARSGLASFNWKTGNLTNWNPDIGQVTWLAKAGTKLIAGGTFQQVNSQGRIFICMFDVATGNLENWQDTANYSWQSAIGADGNYFYFDKTPPSSTGSVIARADASTGTTTSWRSSHLPIQGGEIATIWATSNFVYVGGNFMLSNPNSIYSGLCRFYKTNGALDTAWHPQPSGFASNYGVTSIVGDDNHLFVGGEFSTMGNQTRHGVAEFDASGNLTNFAPIQVGVQVSSLYLLGDNLWIGCNQCHIIGGKTRYRIAEVNIYTGIATCWDATPTTTNWTTAWNLNVVKDTVFAANTAGNVTIFSGSPRPYIDSSLISGSVTVSPQQVVTYTLPNQSGNTYSWYVIGGTGSSNTNSITVTWGNGPSGIIKVVENNPLQSDCSSDTAVLHVSFATVDVRDLENIQLLQISPNPAANQLNINLGGLQAEQVSIYNTNGQLLSEVKQPTGNMLDISSLANGVYVAEIKIRNATQRVRWVKM